MFHAVLLPLLFAVADGGVVPGRIVNGEVAVPHAYPWQLSFQVHGQHKCGAVLIAPGIALTAAHCTFFFYPSEMSVVCGAHNLAAQEDTAQRLYVDRDVMHPDFKFSGGTPAYPNDIALLQLSSNASLNHYCQLAQLGDPNQNYSSHEAVITGWGMLYGGGPTPDRLREGHVTVLTPEQCAATWGDNVQADMHVCVKDLDVGDFGACKGDSGGPVHVNNGTVIGVTSFGITGCLLTHPSVYTRVSSYLQWIWSTARRLQA